jgi:putative transposase
MMRKVKLVEGEYYHIFNRGVDKRTIFQNSDDFDRFLLSMLDFNSLEPIGSIYEHSFQKKSELGNLVSKSVYKSKNKKQPLVELVVYCLNPNHFHFILRQVASQGIEKFMHRLGLGFTKYFNLKYKRSGALFQGTFKAVHIESNEQLIHLSAYVNLNNRVHGIKDFRSSWDEYLGRIKPGICQKEIVLGQFKNSETYRKLSEGTVREVKDRRESDKLTNLILE